MLGGPYAITQGTLAANSNYSVTGYTGANLSIAARAITLTADAQSKTYGNNDPTLTYVVGGSGLANNAGIGVVDTQAGVFSGSQTRAAGETVLGGPYAITQGTLAANSNYNVTGYTGANLSIAARAITLTADAQTKTYGNNDPTLTYVVGGSGLANNAGIGVVDTQATVFTGNQTRAVGETVTGGPYAITQGTLAANSNYNLTAYTGANLSIAARNIIVTADAQSKTYGNNDPTLSYVVGGSGLANNAAIGVVDTQATVFTGSQTRTTGETVLGGPYAITQGTLLAVNSNYNLAGYTGANLTISPALLTITAEDKARFFGQPNPLFSAIYSGLKLADTPTSVGAGLQFSTPANSSSTIGNYPITPFGLGSGNYTISYFSGNLRIDASVPPAINIVPGGLTGLFGGLTQAPLFVASVNLSSSFGGINSLPAPAAGPASVGDANAASSEDSAGAPGSSNNTRAAPSAIESGVEVIGESQPRLFEPGMSCSPASPMQAFSCR